MGNGYYTASLGGKQVKVAAKYVLVIVAAVCFASGFAAGLLVDYWRAPTVGRIVIVTPPPPPELKLNVFADENCTSVLTEIDWGTLEPPDTKSVAAFVKNLGDVPFTMTLHGENWNPPEIEQHMTVSWTYANETISKGEILQVTFRLAVKDGAPEGSFSFDIVITATEA